MPTRCTNPEAQRRAVDAYLKLNRVANNLQLTVGRTVQEAGLTLSQYGALETVYFCGDQTISSLAQKNLTSRNNLTVVVHNLARSGYVKIEGHPLDRRAVLVRLTAKGRDLIEDLMPKHTDGVSEAFSVLSPREIDQLTRLLGKLDDLEEAG